MMKKITPAQARAIFDALVDDKGRIGRINVRTYGALRDSSFIEWRHVSIRNAQHTGALVGGAAFVTEAGYRAAREFYGWDTLRGATMGTAWTNKQQSEQDEQNRLKRSIAP